MSTDNRRRRLLQAGFASTALGAVPGVQVIRGAAAAAAPSRVLVNIHLNGGCDTLNTVVPYADANYHRIRGELAIPRAAALALDARTGLHPALAGLKRLWDGGRVAIVHGVGYPAFDYSHFQAMEIYWTADPARASATGWLGRSVDQLVAGNAAPDALTAAAITWSSPPSLIARTFTAPQLPDNADAFWLPDRGPEHFAALRRVLQQPPTTTNFLYDGYLRGTRAALGAYDVVKTAGALATPVTYPDNGFASGLRFAAQLLRTDGAIRVIAMDQGSYDTHENQAQQLQDSLAELDGGLAAFFADLDAQGIADRVLVMLWSEFARRVEPNASRGTDHGAAQAMVLLGSGVRGGIVGAPPSLLPADLVDDGNLPMQVDFRRLYATLLDGWLGVSSRAVLGDTYSPVPVLR